MTAGFVLGIDFGGTHVGIATMGASGEEVLRRTRLATRGAAPEVLRRSLEAARALAAGTPGRLTAVGVSTFGVVVDGQVQLAPNVPGWEGLALPKLLREEFGGTRIGIDNDVKAATAAEVRWGRLGGVDVGVYLNLGTGLSAGIVTGGRLLRGTHGGAGEIGYLLRVPDEPGYAAGHAPLEEFISGSALARRGAALLGEPVTAAELFARRREPPVRELLDESLDALAMSLVNLCVTLDPSVVVVGGGMMGAAAQIIPRLRAAVARAVPFPPEIVAARFVADAALYGALSLALNAAPPSPGP